MTEPTSPEITPEAVPEVEVLFEGRKIWMRHPTAEQLLVWQRTLRHLQTLPEGTSWTADEVMRMLERYRMLIDSLIVHKADVIWLDDGFLDLTMTFQKIMPLVGLTVDAFAEAAKTEGNREQRRAAAKTEKKAVRKKAPEA